MVANEPSPVVDRSELDDRLADVLSSFLAAWEEGIATDPEKLIAEHPDIAEQLRECLRNLRFIEQVASNTNGAMKLDDVGDGERVLGDYRIIRQIARGGMGIVYEAEQISLGRSVALKTLPFAAVLDRRQLQRFKNEAQAAASLRHPHIVSVHAVGCERGMHFFAMDLIEGQSLAEIIDELRTLARGSLNQRCAQRDVSAITDGLVQGRYLDPQRCKAAGESTAAASKDPTMDESSQQAKKAFKYGITTDESASTRGFFHSVAQLGIQAAEALDYAHHTGVVHRDIKPSNLLIDMEGQLFVADFGLATTGADANLTMTGDLLGTMRYMSPEQAAGKRALDHRTDIYSLGVTLYELLTLQPAFPHEDRQKLLREIDQCQPRAPRTIDRTIPRDLETIVLKAIAKEPTSRFQTAQELADDLQRFLDWKPIRATEQTV